LTALVAVGVSTHGCLYGFAGGGLPPHIRTVAILPFENQTVEPTLTQSVSDAVREALENRLGLRQASEQQADAVVRGSIGRYEQDRPLSTSVTAGGNPFVTRRLVQITVTVEIFDQREGRMLWQRSGLTVEGEYDPPQVEDGIKEALDRLKSDIVDGAQSQW
jgi:Lipopolysaccharide-assembly